jgi:hypothetical protein
VADIVFEFAKLESVPPGCISTAVEMAGKVPVTELLIVPSLRRACAVAPEALIEAPLPMISAVAFADAAGADEGTVL